MADIGSIEVQIPEKERVEDIEERHRRGDELRSKLHEHFSDPYTRICKHKGLKRFPEKIILLILVCIFSTYQMFLFGDNRTQFSTFVERNEIALKHLLLKRWSKTMFDPPSTGTYAIYTKEDLIQHINYTISNVYSIPKTSVGSFILRKLNNTNNAVNMCLYYYNTGIYNEITEEFVMLDQARKTECRDVGNNYAQNYGFNPSIEDLMRSSDGMVVRLLAVDINFKLTSLHLNIETGKKARCLGIDGNVHFENKNINGQITVKLTVILDEFSCNSQDGTLVNATDIVISVFVLLLCSTHGFSCFLSFGKSANLCLKTCKFYKEETGIRLSNRARFEIIKLNDLLLVLANTITIAGSGIKLKIDIGETRSTTAHYDSTGILLGIGCVLIWISILHYLAYDHVFSLLFSVMERSAWQVIKFFICISFIFAGFVLCGWIVLGPYHVKFASFKSSTQSLIALTYGDEIYATFTAVDSDKQLVWYFNAFFLASFLALFALVTLNIFIAIFNTAYEQQKDGEYKREHRSDLLKFLDKYEVKSFDVSTCSKCVSCACPLFLGWMWCCDEEKHSRNSISFSR